MPSKTEQFLVDHTTHHVRNVGFLYAISKLFIEAIAAKKGHEGLEILLLAVVRGCWYRKRPERSMLALSGSRSVFRRAIQSWEMADHKRFTLATDIKVYFCDPQHPWQRGSNENTNGLLRQYFPKGMDLSNVHQNRLNAVARRLNERSRETLNFETPAERFSQCVASIV